MKLHILSHDIDIIHTEVLPVDFIGYSEFRVESTMV